MQRRVFRLLWNEAWRHAQPQRSKHAAAIVLDGQVIAIGRNSDKTHPLQQRFAKHEEAIQLHAEIDAIAKFFSKYHQIYTIDDLKRADLYVARVKHQDSGRIRNNSWWGNSEPCIGCRRAIETFGFRSVYFTLDSPYQNLNIEEWHR